MEGGRNGQKPVRAFELFIDAEDFIIRNLNAPWDENRDIYFNRTMHLSYHIIEIPFGFSSSIRERDR
jgi:hypothetical protein